MNSQEIQKYIPNRYPYLMIDRVTEVVPGVYAKGYKNLSLNEWYYPVHFDNEPIMPGAMQMETMIQMLTMAIVTMEDNIKKVVKARRADNFKMKRRVVPGDRLDIEAEIIEILGNEVKGRAKGFVDGELACEALLVLEII
ncbi:MAG: 3-hydroxyacyl-ACP dehydratase FabZ [Lachnospiraceae bacterium]|nr:3-hydroxyacyl-ACP dehydratase FabZ [Lachnospiraceae bacterium]